jgi:hypothetical protein
MVQANHYKKFRVSINTKTLLDDFAPILIDDIAKRFKTINLLKESFCQKALSHASQMQQFSEFGAIVQQLREFTNQVKEDFKDCEENASYFSLACMGAVSAGKTSLICDLLNLNPDELNTQLRACTNFDAGEDEVLIAGEVATTNVYEFLIESSHIRLVDVPGTGGVVHDNTTLAPFVNMADCLIFLSNAQSDLTRDDYNFVVQHIVGAKDAKDITPETASDKKALIVVNKWKTVTQDLRPEKHEEIWRKKKEWILWGDSKKGDGKRFEGLSKLFKRTLVIVPANTTKRFLDEATGTYDRYGEMQLDEMLDALKNILIEEGIQIKLERPKLILKQAMVKVEDLLENERTKRSVDELVAKLKQLGVKVSVNSNEIMNVLDTRLNGLEARIRRDLFYQIKETLDEWKPSVSFIDRIKGLWPKGWWGSDQFGAVAVQEELKARWKQEIEALLRQNINTDAIKREVQGEAAAIAEHLKGFFKIQLADLQQQTMEERILKGLPAIGIDDRSLDPTESTRALERAIEEATARIQHNLVDDLIGIVAIDAVIGLLLGAILTPLGSAIFFALRRWLSGQDEERKAKQELEEAIQRIADETAANLRQTVAAKLRNVVQTAVERVAKVVQSERETLSKPLQSLDQAIESMKNLREELDALTIR